MNGLDEILQQVRNLPEDKRYKASIVAIELLKSAQGIILKEAEEANDRYKELRRQSRLYDKAIEMLTAIKKVAGTGLEIKVLDNMIEQIRAEKKEETDGKTDD